MCLVDYIGIKFCENDTEPDSGLYINSLPGISVNAMENFADEEQATYLGLWADAQKEAWADFETYFYNELAMCHEICKDLRMRDLICDNKKQLAVAWKYLLGVKLMQYAQFGNNLNFFTLDKDQIQKQMNFYQVEFESSLRRAVKSLDLSGYGHEVVCAPAQIKSVSWLP